MTVQPKNLDLAELVTHDTAHHFHPFTNHKTFHAEGGARVITHADGVWIWDAKGNRILDAMAGLWCVNVGYGRKELAEAASRQMLARLRRVVKVSRSSGPCTRSRSASVMISPISS